MDGGSIQIMIQMSDLISICLFLMFFQTNNEIDL